VSRVIEFVIRTLGLDAIHCYAKFEVATFTRYGNTKGDTKYTK